MWGWVGDLMNGECRSEKRKRTPHGKGFMTVFSKVGQGSWMISYQYSSRIVTITIPTRIESAWWILWFFRTASGIRALSSAPINGDTVVAVIATLRDQQKIAR